jgi:hypothetical protein
VGLDKDKGRLEAAAAWCEEIVAADLETELDQTDPRPAAWPDGFDVACLLDVLEHVRNPNEVLQWASKLVRPGGLILVSLPNITHAAVRLQLLSGRFSYTPTGLLDRGHVHFYDREEAETLIADAGLQIIERLVVRRGIDETEIDVPHGELPIEVVTEACRGDDALTYQFFYIVAPGGTNVTSPVATELQRRLQSRSSELADALALVQSLEEEVIAQRDRVAERDAVLTHQQRTMDDQLRQVRSLKADLELKQRYVDHLQGELEQRLRECSDLSAQVTALDDQRSELRAAAEVAGARVVELENILAATTSRAGYRLMEKINTAFAAVPGLQGLARRIVRRLVATERSAPK